MIFLQIIIEIDMQTALRIGRGIVSRKTYHYIGITRLSGSRFCLTRWNGQLRYSFSGFGRDEEIKSKGKEFYKKS